MQILIYGAGSVGLGIASCLIKAGQKVSLLGRPETVAALQKKGLKRSGIFGNFEAKPRSFCAVSSLSKIPKSSFDFILVCTKSFDS